MISDSNHLTPPIRFFVPTTISWKELSGLLPVLILAYTLWALESPPPSIQATGSLGN